MTTVGTPVDGLTQASKDVSAALNVYSGQTFHTMLRCIDGYHIGTVTCADYDSVVGSGQCQPCPELSSCYSYTNPPELTTVSPPASASMPRCDCFEDNGQGGCDLKSGFCFIDDTCEQDTYSAVCTNADGRAVGDVTSAGTTMPQNEPECVANDASNSWTMASTVGLADAHGGSVFSLLAFTDLDVHCRYSSSVSVACDMSFACICVTQILCSFRIMAVVRIATHAAVRLQKHGLRTEAAHILHARYPLVTFSSSNCLSTLVLLVAYQMIKSF